MFSEELEKLIQSSVEDGVITDLERKVLVKRAQKENVDLDELNVYIEGLLQKKQKENQAAAPQENKRAQYHGKVIKCPSCNEPIEAGLAVCPSCGYEFHGVEANKSVKELGKLLDEVSKKEYPGDDALETKKEAAIAATISSFPIPPTKDDFIEFIHFLKTGYLEKHNFGAASQAYRRKINECFERAKISFPNDPLIKSMQQDLQVIYEKDDANNKRAAWFLGGCMVICILGVFLFILFGLLGCFD